MIGGFADVPTDDAENVLFQLAEGDTSLYANHAWHDAVERRGTLSAALRYVDLAVKSAFEVKGPDHRHMARQFGGLIAAHPELRAYVYELLKSGTPSPGLALLARAVAEEPDAEGLLLLIKIKPEQTHSLSSWRTIESVVTEHVPAENWRGAYDIVPVPAAGLRRKLLAMTTDGGHENAAARCLNLIDCIRDVYGAPDSDPRHPDFASGRSWPVMTPDPDAT